MVISIRELRKREAEESRHHQELQRREALRRQEQAAQRAETLQRTEALIPRPDPAEMHPGGHRNVPRNSAAPGPEAEPRPHRPESAHLRQRQLIGERTRQEPPAPPSAPLSLPQPLALPARPVAPGRPPVDQPGLQDTASPATHRSRGDGVLKFARFLESL